MPLFIFTVVVGLATAAAAPKSKSIFLIDRVLLAEGLPQRLEAPVRAHIATLVAEQPELLSEMPADAPDPAKDAAAFEKYLKKKSLRAFRVRVEVSRFKSQSETKDGKNWLWIDVGLRLFGETIPGQSFGFTGDGAASIKIEVGPTVRPRDQEYAESEALKEAMGKAMNTAIQSLKAKPKTPKKKP
jgi:hypothetical protein